jgi:hypothetical protein
VSLLLDSGALIAYERGSRTVHAFLRVAAERGDAVKTSTAVVAQVWRRGARQVSIAKLLRGVEELELSRARARGIGALLARTKTADVVDASLVEIAIDGDEILTSDPDDMLRLARGSGKTLIVTKVS